MSIYKRLGDYIQTVDNRNKELAVTNLLGINITKNFMPSVANVSETDLSKYKLIKKGQFATNIMHVGRDKRLPVALYRDDNPSIVSPAYKTFEVLDEKILHPEFLMIQFERPEYDRLTWYYCDSSIRGGLDWDRFCDIEIPIPDIEEQKRYVAIYKGLLTNQSSYQNSLDDLQLICNLYMDELKTHSNIQPISKYVDLVDFRNKDKTISNLRGINVDKVFMPSKANVSETDLSKYKVIEKGQFAYSAMQVGRDKTVRVVLYSDNKPAIISPAYLVFKIKEKAPIIAEFLMIWFYRPEFNRYGWFISDSSVRASLEWERFIEIKIPVPDIKIQVAIVSIYNALESRKKINEKLKYNIKPLCPVLIRGLVEGN